VGKKCLRKTYFLGYACFVYGYVLYPSLLAELHNEAEDLAKEQLLFINNHFDSPKDLKKLPAFQLLADINEKVFYGFCLE
jgi:hypothetical protein